MVSVAWGCVELVLRTFLTYILVEQLPSCEDWYHGAAGVPSSATFFYHISLKLERSIHQERFICVQRAFRQFKSLNIGTPSQVCPKPEIIRCWEFILGNYHCKFTLVFHPAVGLCCQLLLERGYWIFWVSGLSPYSYSNFTSVQAEVCTQQRPGPFSPLTAHILDFCHSMWLPFTYGCRPCSITSPFPILHLKIFGDYLPLSPTEKTSV